MKQPKSNSYRWLGLAALFIALMNNWVGAYATYLYLDPLARLLLLLFTIYYWRDRRDGFAIILVVFAFIVFILGITNLTGLYQSPSPL